MIDRIRALLTVIEEGSVNRAAVRLRITQPALSRQIQSLEHELGGKLLERESSGVKPTSLGHALVKSMTPVVDTYTAALAELRRRARGERAELRVGYLISAAPSVLTPAVTRFRQVHPELTLKLHDLSPREQIEGLRAGDLDVALVGQEGSVAAREFHSTKLGSLRVCVAMASNDGLAGRTSIALRELKAHRFIGIDENEMPGRNAWMSALARIAGFKPRFVVVVDGLSQVLSAVAAEKAVTLLPAYFREFQHPGVVFVPISDERATWEFIVLWQRGKVPPTVRALVEELRVAANRFT